MRKAFLTLITLLILSISSCKDKVQYDKEYLIFLNTTTWDSGLKTLKYEIFKIDKDFNKFASGKAGITANSINLDDDNTEENVAKSFKQKYPDSRIYVDDRLYN